MNINHQISNLNFKSLENNNFTITGYASVFNVSDQHNDIICAGAYKNSLDPASVKFLWQHDFNKPVGIITKIEEDNYGLKIEAIINDKITLGKEAIELIKQKAIEGLSVGFNVIDSDYDNEGVRIIKEVELVEISIVTFPANKRAQIFHSNTKSTACLKQTIKNFNNVIKYIDYI